jgi:hypothetical protein
LAQRWEQYRRRPVREVSTKIVTHSEQVGSFLFVAGVDDHLPRLQRVQGAVEVVRCDRVLQDQSGGAAAVAGSSASAGRGLAGSAARFTASSP